MDNLDVRLPVDATTKSKFKDERAHESYETRNDFDSRRVHREIIEYWSRITIRA
jgi:hypothetical protein